MADISNRTLVGLLVVAIVVSLAGTFVSLNKLGTISSISGAATNDTGTVSLTIQGNAELTLRVNAVNFGSGKINGSTTPGIDYCDLRSNVSAAMGGNTFTPSAAVLGSGCFGGFVAVNETFVIENTGNQEFSNVTMNSTFAQLWPPMLGGDLTSNGTYAYQIHEEVTSGRGSCDVGGLTMQSQFNDMTNVSSVVCFNFSSTPSLGNAFAVQINVSIPEHANATSQGDTLSFIGNV